MSIERLRIADNGLLEVHSQGPMCWYEDYEELQQSKHVMPPFAAPANQHSAWVSVKDSMPGDTQWVLIANPGAELEVVQAMWLSGSRTFESHQGWFDEEDVQWWMPMPPLPKEVLEQPQV